MCTSKEEPEYISDQSQDHAPADWTKMQQLAHQAKKDSDLKELKAYLDELSCYNEIYQRVSDGPYKGDAVLHLIIKNPKANGSMARMLVRRLVMLGTVLSSPGSKVKNETQERLDVLIEKRGKKFKSALEEGKNDRIKALKALYNEMPSVSIEEVRKKLIAINTPENATYFKIGRSPIEVAIEYQRTDILKEFCEKNPELLKTRTSDKGFFPLQYAAYMLKPHAFVFLINSNPKLANAKQSEKFGRNKKCELTPLQIALESYTRFSKRHDGKMKGYQLALSKILTALVKHGVKVKLEDIPEDMPLGYIPKEILEEKFSKEKEKNIQLQQWKEYLSQKVNKYEDKTDYLVN